MSSAICDADFYVKPDPVAVAKLVQTHGAEAANARWYWMGERTLGSLARRGRALLGVDVGAAPRRKHSASAEQTFVFMCAVAIVKSHGVAERVAGLGVNAGRALLEMRGMTVPTLRGELRTRRAVLSATVKRRGDDEVGRAARVELDAMDAFERGLGEVLRAVYPLARTQPSVGPCRLPARGEALRRALAGCDRRAVEAVFPGLLGGAS